MKLEDIALMRCPKINSNCMMEKCVAWTMLEFESLSGIDIKHDDKCTHYTQRKFFGCSIFSSIRVLIGKIEHGEIMKYDDPVVPSDLEKVPENWKFRNFKERL